MKSIITGKDYLLINQITEQRHSRKAHKFSHKARLSITNNTTVCEYSKLFRTPSAPIGTVMLTLALSDWQTACVLGSLYGYWS